MTTPTSTNFWEEFALRVPQLELALQNGDAELLARLVDELAVHISQVDHRLNVTVYGPDPFRIGILATPGAESIADLFVDTSVVPENWLVGVGPPPEDPLKAVLVRDDSGASLRIEYDDLKAAVLPQSDGSAIVVLALAADFDPKGPEKHLYKAVADNVVSTLLGGSPPQLRYSALIPLSSVGGARMRPVLTLREQWQQAMARGAITNG